MIFQETTTVAENSSEIPLDQAMNSIVEQVLSGTGVPVTFAFHEDDYAQAGREIGSFNLDRLDSRSKIVISQCLEKIQQYLDLPVADDSIDALTAEQQEMVLEALSQSQRVHLEEYAWKGVGPHGVRRAFRDIFAQEIPDFSSRYENKRRINQMQNVFTSHRMLVYLFKIIVGKVPDGSSRKAELQQKIKELDNLQNIPLSELVGKQYQEETDSSKKMAFMENVSQIALSSLKITQEILNLLP